jgi:hypothetical protein
VLSRERRPVTVLPPRTKKSRMAEVRGSIPSASWRRIASNQQATECGALTTFATPLARGPGDLPREGLQYPRPTSSLDASSPRRASS